MEAQGCPWPVLSPVHPLPEFTSLSQSPGGGHLPLILPTHPPGGAALPPLHKQPRAQSRANPTLVLPGSNPTGFPPGHRRLQHPARCPWLVASRANRLLAVSTHCVSSSPFLCSRASLCLKMPTSKPMREGLLYTPQSPFQTTPHFYSIWNTITLSQVRCSVQWPET